MSTHSFIADSFNVEYKALGPSKREHALIICSPENHVTFTFFDDKEEGKAFYLGNQLFDQVVKCWTNRADHQTWYTLVNEAVHEACNGNYRDAIDQLYDLIETLEQRDHIEHFNEDDPRGER
jgi:Fe-S cluster biosynthesis and repair protein YggX